MNPKKSIKIASYEEAINILKRWEKTYRYVHMFASHRNINETTMKEDCLLKHPIIKDRFIDELFMAYVFRIICKSSNYEKIYNHLLHIKNGAKFTFTVECSDKSILGYGYRACHKNGKSYAMKQYFTSAVLLIRKEETADWGWVIETMYPKPNEKQQFAIQEGRKYFDDSTAREIADTFLQKLKDAKQNEK